MTRLTSYMITTGYWLSALFVVPLAMIVFSDCERLDLGEAACSDKQGWVALAGLVAYTVLYLVIRRWLKARVTAASGVNPEPRPYIFATALYWFCGPPSIVATVTLLGSCGFPGGQTACTTNPPIIWFGFAAVALGYFALLAWLGRKSESENRAASVPPNSGRRTLATIVYWCAAFFGLSPLTVVFGHCIQGLDTGCTSRIQQVAWGCLVTAIVGYVILLRQLGHERASGS